MTTKQHFENNIKPFFNINEYFDNGFKGKGVIVASVESTDSDHGNNVKDTILTYAPECKVISFDDEHPDYSATGDNGENVRFPEFVDWCIENKVDIVTSSLDWLCDKKEEQQAIKKLYDAGIIFCNCAGNSGNNITRDDIKKTWDFDKEVITVSGVMLNTSGKVSWSGFNYGEAVDVCTIGSNTPTIDYETGTVYSWSGTSSATPMMAGLLATYKSYDNNLNSKNVFELINNSYTPYIYKEKEYKIFKLPKLNEFHLKKVEDNMEDKDYKDTSDWAKEARAYLMSIGVTDGTNPKAQITREEVWTMLYRLYNIYQ